MARYKDDKEKNSFEEKYNASLITRRRPPVPEYDALERAYLEANQHKFRCSTILMVNKATGHKIKVSTHDAKRRLELAQLGYETDNSTPRDPKAGEKIELSSAAKKELSDQEFISRVKVMNKAELLDLAKKMNVPAVGKVEELRNVILEKVQDQEASPELDPEPKPEPEE